MVSTTTTHRIVFGDSRNMSLLEDESVHLIITSPPYWQLKDYGDTGQIGFGDSYEQYINNLNLVWKECARVLKPGCRLCVNIGDQFARSAYYGRYKVIPIRTEIIRFCEAMKLDYMGAVIWQKVTTMNASGGGAVMGSFPYPRNGILKMDYEFILLFKKLGNPPVPTEEQKLQSAMTREEWGQYFSSHWTFPGVRQEGHLAMFPEELPRRLIRMFSFVGETVLDPFAGSGTTALAAKHNGRNSVGYEINADFRPVIQRKLGDDQGDLFLQPASVEFIEAPDVSVPDTTTLPYLFHDPHRMDKKVDVKRRTYGSKIDGSEAAPLTYAVREVISPDTIRIGDGQLVKLLGVVSIPQHAEAAVQFLTQKFHKHRIFLRPDPAVQDDADGKACYVYLDNRTFVNLHLVRTGLVGVDRGMEYRCRDKFLRALPG